MSAYFYLYSINSGLIEKILIEFAGEKKKHFFYAK